MPPVRKNIYSAPLHCRRYSPAFATKEKAEKSVKGKRARGYVVGDVYQGALTGKWHYTFVSKTPGCQIKTPKKARKR